MQMPSKVPGRRRKRHISGGNGNRLPGPGGSSGSLVPLNQILNLWLLLDQKAPASHRKWRTWALPAATCPFLPPPGEAAECRVGRGVHPRPCRGNRLASGRWRAWGTTGHPRSLKSHTYLLAQGFSPSLTSQGPTGPWEGGHFWNTGRYPMPAAGTPDLALALPV